MNEEPELILKLRFTPTHDYTAKEKVNKISACLMAEDEVINCVRGESDQLSELSHWLLDLFLKKYIGCEEGDAVTSRGEMYGND